MLMMRRRTKMVRFSYRMRMRMVVIVYRVVVIVSSMRMSIIRVLV